MANEAIDTMIKRKEKGVLCKLDIEKAYDQINWNCIIKSFKKWGLRLSGSTRLRDAYQQHFFQY